MYGFAGSIDIDRIILHIRLSYFYYSLVWECMWYRKYEHPRGILTEHAPCSPSLFVTAINPRTLLKTTLSSRNLFFPAYFFLSACCTVKIWSGHWWERFVLHSWIYYTLCEITFIPVQPLVQFLIYSHCWAPRGYSWNRSWSQFLWDTVFKHIICFISIRPSDVLFTMVTL